MGTNYYHEVVKCEHCGASERYHLGKSSGGWCFSLHVDPENGIHDLPDILTRFDNKGGRIVNEYGDVVSVTQFLEVVSERSWQDSPFPDGWLEANHAVLGPRNIARHKIEGACIGHGSGTWDYIVGEFS